MLNSATGTPRAATCGANIAAGYTTEEVPTTKHKSQLSNSLPKRNMTIIYKMKANSTQLNLHRYNSFT